MSTGDAILIVGNAALGVAIGRGWVDQAAGFVAAWVASRFGGGPRK